MHLKQPGFTCTACGPFTKNKEKFERLMQNIFTTQNIFTKMIFTELVFNMVWIMVNLKASIKEHNQIKF